MPAWTASNATEAGSAPSRSERTVRTPTRLPQVSQLVGRGGPEGVGRAEDDRLVLGHEHPGQLADRGRLAGAVDADDQDDGRPAVGRRRSRGSGPGPGRPGASSSSCSIARTESRSWPVSTLTRSRSRSTSSVLGPTPRSAPSSRSSTPSQSCSLERVAGEQVQQAATRPPSWSGPAGRAAAASGPAPAPVARGSRPTAPAVGRLGCDLHGSVRGGRSRRRPAAVGAVGGARPRRPSSGRPGGRDDARRQPDAAPTTTTTRTAMRTIRMAELTGAKSPRVQRGRPTPVTRGRPQRGRRSAVGRRSGRGASQRVSGRRWAGRG